MDPYGQNTMKDSLAFLTILQKFCKLTLVVKFCFRWNEKTIFMLKNIFRKVP